MLEQPPGRSAEALEEDLFSLVFDPPHDLIMASPRPEVACGGRLERQQSVAIGFPAPHPRPADDPPLDPLAVERGLRRARLRFLFLLLLLVFVILFLSLSIWEKIRDLFGL
jgi:hypothetical protein